MRQELGHEELRQRQSHVGDAVGDESLEARQDALSDEGVRPRRQAAHERGADVHEVGALVAAGQSRHAADHADDAGSCGRMRVPRLAHRRLHLQRRWRRPSRPGRPGRPGRPDRPDRPGGRQPLSCHCRLLRLQQEREQRSDLRDGRDAHLGHLVGAQVERERRQRALDVCGWEDGAKVSELQSQHLAEAPVVRLGAHLGGGRDEG